MKPSTFLLPPPPGLQGCVRAFISRDTEPVALSMRERLNRFPATPLCTMTWFLSGETITVEPEEGILLERVVISGPLTRPVITLNPGPVRAFMVVFYPSALHELTGIETGAMADQFFDPGTLGEDWSQLAARVLQAESVEERIAEVSSFLESRWTPSPRPTFSWLERLNEIAHAGAGSSARSIERRFKAMAGQPLRALRRLDRAERTLGEMKAATATGELAWAQIAADAGYADQAHLCRDVRAITGATPSMLARGDESYWLYRIWK